MRTLHSDKEIDLQKISYEALVSRLDREKRARLEAETLLEKKSLEVYQANQSLAASTAQIDRERTLLSAVFDARPAALILTSSNHDCVRLNPSACGLLGIEVNTVPDTSLLDLLTGSAEALKWIEARTGPNPEFDYSTIDGAISNSSGEEIPVRISCSPIGHDDMCLWILIDIRRHLAIEAEKNALEQSLNQAQKMEALGTLASGVAHEINTPIQYVGDNVRFFQEVHAEFSGLLKTYDALKDAAEKHGILEDLAAEVTRHREECDIDFLLEDTPTALEQSLHGLRQVATIVSAIREFSHPGETETTPVDINSVIETTLSVSRNSWKTITEIEKELQPDLPTVMGHAGDLHQVILNLISNAADAINEDKSNDEGLIRISTRAVADDIEILVSDNGSGISDDVKSRIFDPFFTTKDPGKGTGQGLAIVYKIVHVKHGGRITVESTPESGTTFKIRLNKNAEPASLN